MKLKFFSILTVVFLLLQTVFASGQSLMDTAAQDAAALTLDAQSAILIDASSGTVLYEKNSDDQHYPASITKLMTVLLALEYGHLDETITFSHDAVFSIEPGSSHIAIDEGEEITMRQALYAIMLQSANEVSNGVAEHIDGSMDAFASHMTKRAEELGATGTHFTNANGLHDENHYTTAHDMALIAKELLKFDFFRELMATTYYEIPPTNKQPETRYLYAQNQLIKDSSTFYYPDCEGGKTGYTIEAGNTLVAYAKRDGLELISVVLQSTGYGEYTDTIALFDYGFDHFQAVKALSAGQTVAEVPMAQPEEETSSGSGFSLFALAGEPEEDSPAPVANVIATAAQDCYVTLPLSASPEQIQVTHNLPSAIDKTVYAGDTLGTATLSWDGKVLASVDLKAQNTVESPIDAATQADQQSNQTTKAPINLKLILILLALVAIFLWNIRLILDKISYEKKKRRRRARRKRMLAERNGTASSAPKAKQKNSKENRY